jgi:hypothetical protein
MLAGLGFGQTTTTTTTLSAAVSMDDTVINLTSGTGIVAAASLNQTMSWIFVDRELMAVISGTTAVTVRRAEGGRRQVHNSGATVYIGPASVFPSTAPSGACTATDYAYLPVVNARSGEVWNCIGSQWVIQSFSLNYTSTDGYIFIPPTDCSVLPGTTAFATGSPKFTPVATGNSVLSVTTDTTAGTLQVVCDVNVGTRLTTGKGVTVTDISLFYGVQTTNLASIAAPTVKKVTYPAVGGAAAGTVADAGGTLAILPASLQLTATTTGLCFNEGITLGTPLVMNTDIRRIVVNQVFTTAGSAATTLQVCGLLVHYTNSPL